MLRISTFNCCGILGDFAKVPYYINIEKLFDCIITAPTNIFFRKENARF